MAVGHIYMFTNKVNSKVYIGQTVQTLEDRYGQHLSDSRNRLSRSLAMAINKYGIEHFDFTCLETVETHMLDEREVFYIALYRSSERRFGYNRTKGGQGCAANEETRLKMRMAKLGKPQRPEVVEKRRRVWTPEELQAKEDARVARRERARLRRVETMTGESNTFFGRKHTPESLQKMSEASLGRASWNKGVPHTEETKQKLSAALMGKTPSNKGTTHTEETKAIMRKKRATQVFSEESKTKRAKSLLGQTRTPEQRKNISEACMGRTNSEEHKQACRDAVKALWADPVYRDNMLKSRREKALAKKAA